jgi:hypothetical protein
MKALLQRSTGLPPVKENRPTFLEISGYPHYESVCSNLLKFFFDPAGPHKLGPLFLSALLKDDKPNFGRVYVEREVIIPSSDARIDLLISCEPYLVVIENKIFHEVSNPFAKYAAYADTRADGRIVKKFLLVLKAPDVAPGYEFQELTYASFQNEVYQRLKEYPGEPDPHYQILMYEFFNTIQKLQKAHSIMTPEHLKFFSEDKDHIDNLLESVDQFKQELRDKVTELASLMRSSKYARQSKWNKGPYVYDTLVHDIRLGNNVEVAVDATITAAGWDISVIRRRGLDPYQLKALLKNLQISFESESEDGNRLILPQRFSYDEPLTSVQAALQPVIDKISQSTNLPI